MVKAIITLVLGIIAAIVIAKTAIRFMRKEKKNGKKSDSSKIDKL